MFRESDFYNRNLLCHATIFWGKIREIILCSAVSFCVEMTEILLSQFLDKNFVKTTLFTKKLLKSRLDEIIFC